MTDVQADPLVPLGAIWCTSFDCILSYSSDEYIRWYRGITRVYIKNPANRDTRSVGYQLAGVDKRMIEVDDMASVVIQEPPLSLSQMAVFMKKVQTIIRSTIYNRHSQYNRRVAVPGNTYWTGVLMELRGALVGSLVMEQEVDAFLSLLFPADPDMQTPDTSRCREVRDLERWREVMDLEVDTLLLGSTQPSQSLSGGSGILHAPPPSGLGFAPFQSPAGISLGFSSFFAPPPLGTDSSSTSHSLYRKHLHLMKKSGRMTRMMYIILDSDIVLGKRQRGSRRPTGHSCT
ncbi:hypothetical protein M9H77_26327 [Catharanthus roseus]|uniref:Uncharacterized protein n=1 Tax=Catharanthus roseus TaxID=4058 RepID=A0ACC0A9P5_CATRO|nr:hypothetical protein M9H77_26327 [Catharanthus roseus]